MSQAVMLCDGLSMSAEMQEVQPQQEEKKKHLNSELRTAVVEPVLVINVQWILHPIDPISRFILLPPNYQGITQ